MKAYFTALVGVQNMKITVLKWKKNGILIVLWFSFKKIYISRPKTPLIKFKECSELISSAGI